MLWNSEDNEFSVQFCGDEWYGVAGGGRVPSYPTPQAEEVRLWAGDDVLAVARYVTADARDNRGWPDNGYTVDDTGLFRTWQEAIADALTDAELPDAIEYVNNYR